MNGADSATFTLYRRFAPIFIIGDSHCLPLIDTGIRDEITGQGYITKCSYCPGLTAASFTSLVGNRNINTDVGNAMKAHGLLSKSGDPVHAAVDQLSAANAHASGMPQVAPILMFLCGCIDVRNILLPQLNNTATFINPDDHDQAVPPGLDVVPVAHIRNAITRIIDPLLFGLDRLKQAGFERLYLHNLPPPTLRDELYAKMNGYPCPATTRYRVARLYNSMLAARCREQRIGFVDIWRLVTDQAGLIHPNFELDGVHLSRKAALFTLGTLLTHVREQAERSLFNAARFGVATEVSAPLPNGDAAAAEQLRSVVSKFTAFADSVGFGAVRGAPSAAPEIDFPVRVVTPAKGIASIRVADAQTWQWETANEDLRTEIPSADWCRRNPEVEPRECRRLDISELRRLYDVLYGESVRPIWRHCYGQDVLFYQAALNRHRGSSHPLWMTDTEFPPHCSVVIYNFRDRLSVRVGSDEAFEIPPNSITTIRPTELSGIPEISGDDGLTFIEALVGPRHVNQPRLIVSTMLGRWPMDPFQFSTRGMTAFPEAYHPEVSISMFLGAAS